MTTIKHELYYIGANGPVKLEEVEMDWDINESDLSTSHAQVSILRWELETLIPERIFVKRQVLD